MPSLASVESLPANGGVLFEWEATNMITLELKGQPSVVREVPKSTWIYFLYDDLNNVRYIGKTKQIASRMSRYRHPRSLVHRDNWLRAMHKSGRQVTMSLVEECNDENWIERECYWIQFGKDQGWDLTNHTDGGEGGSGRRYVMSDAQKLAISKARKGQPCPEWQKEHLRKINTGKKHSEESKQKMSERLKGNQYAKGSKGWVGLRHFEESKEKMRQSSIRRERRPHSEESKEKMRQAAFKREASKRQKRLDNPTE